jgi:hypothetical protein
MSKQPTTLGQLAELVRQCVPRSKVERIDPARMLPAIATNKVDERGVRTLFLE